MPNVRVCAIRVVDDLVPDNHMRTWDQSLVASLWRRIEALAESESPVAQRSPAHRGDADVYEAASDALARRAAVNRFFGSA